MDTLRTSCSVIRSAQRCSHLIQVRMRQLIKAGVSPVEVTRLLAEAWREADEATRKKFQEESLKQRQEVKETSVKLPKEITAESLYILEHRAEMLKSHPSRCEWWK